MATLTIGVTSKQSLPGAAQLIGVPSTVAATRLLISTTPVGSGLLTCTTNIKSPDWPAPIVTVLPFVQVVLAQGGVGGVQGAPLQAPKSCSGSAATTVVFGGIVSVTLPAYTVPASVPLLVNLSR
ncbi:hypothetical protein ABU614_00820 [Lysobacter firmicutimachus]|uniref:Uncharacterized protein n=1 Tax=Lysobacter firmicutimachus TaxID=1792846 RepID=A0AAU8MT42_9GAMM